MKKNILYLSLAFTALLGANSCSLEEENLSAVSTDKEWSTAAGYEKKINDCYFDMIRIIYGQAEDTYVMMSETGTDIWVDANPDGSNGNWSKVMRYTDFGPSVYMFSEGYTGFYGTLSACNAAVYYAEKVQGLSKEEVNALVAEAHFIRAHVLLGIVEYFGGKYLPLQPISSAMTTLPCSTVNEFYDAILSDLKFAMEHLPLEQALPGKVTRGAAYHLYAKACLSYASYTDGLGNCEAITQAESTELLKEAQRACNELINNASKYGVRLYADIDEVFDEYNNKTNEEALFVVCHSTITALNPRGNYFNRVWKHSDAYNENTAGIYMGGMKNSYDTSKEVNGVTYTFPKLAKGNCYMMPSKYMLDLYGEKDGRYEAFFKDTWYVNTATNDEGNAYTWSEGDADRFGLNHSRVGNAAYNLTLGDTAVYVSRKTYTDAERQACRYAIMNIEDNYADPAKPLRFFPSLKKADTPSMYMGQSRKPYSAADCIIYRLGETYLLAAEAAFRLGDNATAASMLNIIRNRACENHDGSMNITASDVTQDFLLDEYAREMIGEWNRWTTLKRFRAFESRLAKGNPQASPNFKKDYYLRPIPANEILLIDNGAEYQNPGY
ncbi:MAG: RagB/SusD family nutrient uptake outer membrane protein [Bacteroides sp.]|nr:RagB/SusD family nutrient uptake outer membrane protein [Bacteroides sp.]